MHIFFRFRKEEATTRAVEIKQKFKEKIEGIGRKLILHFGGKIVADYTDGLKSKRERIAVLVSSPDLDEEQLLGVPPIEGGTAEEITDGILSVLEKWGLDGSDIVGLSFDTTAVNTGKWSGANVRLEREMMKQMLYLACRHHVFEVIIKCVATEVGRPTKGAEDTLFKRFRDEGWGELIEEGIDMENLVKFDSVNASTFVRTEAEKTLEFLTQHLLTNKFIREDYRELCELAVVYLGGPVEKFRFQTPGPVHHARFMGKCIYYLKCGLLQLQTGTFHQNEIREINILSEFVGVFFVNWWFKSPFCAAAPAQDLTAYWLMKKYSVINPEVATPCLRSLEHHLWYLTQVHRVHYSSFIPNYFLRII